MKLTDEERNARAEKSQELARQIAGILMGNEPDVVGAALADLVAVWLAGHPSDDLRKQVFAHFVATVIPLVEINSKMLTERDEEGNPV